MKQTHAGIVFLALSLLACIVPGLSQPAPAPVNSADISTIVAGTANAIYSQTAAAGQGAVVQPPIETPAVISVETATPLPGAQPAFSAYNSALVKQPDGSVMFIDKQAGYQLLVPVGWLAIRPSHEEYYSVWANEAIAYPYLADELTLIKEDDPTSVRLHAFNIVPGNRQDLFVPHFAIQWLESSNSLKKDAKEVYEFQRASIPSTKAITVAEERQTPIGLAIIITEYTLRANNIHGQEVYVYLKWVFFQTHLGVTGIQISFLADEKDIVKPAFDQMINGIVTLQP